MQQIRRLREERGWSRERLAKAAGVTMEAVKKWETRGVEHAQYGAMRRLARALGVRMEELSDDAEQS